MKRKRSTRRRGTTAQPDTDPERREQLSQAEQAGPSSRAHADDGDETMAGLLRALFGAMPMEGGATTPDGARAVAAALDAAIGQVVMPALPTTGGPVTGAAFPGPGLRERDDLVEVERLAGEFSAKVAAVLDDWTALTHEAGRRHRDTAAAAGRQPRAELEAWLDQCEAIWAERAFADDAVARRVDALHAWLRWRAAHDALADRAAEKLGVPSRRELDEIHRQLDALRRRGDHQR